MIGSRYCMIYHHYEKYTLIQQKHGMNVFFFFKKKRQKRFQKKCHILCLALWIFGTHVAIPTSRDLVKQGDRTELDLNTHPRESVEGKKTKQIKFELTVHKLVKSVLKL